MARWIRVICIVFLATGYLLLTGCAPSTVRAVLMVTILSGAFLSAAGYNKSGKKDPVDSGLVIGVVVGVVAVLAICAVCVWLFIKRRSDARNSTESGDAAP